VVDELESVTGEYRYAVRRHASRLLRNLLRPYVLYVDVQELHIDLDLLDGALRDSPSLRADADVQVAQAWAAELSHAAMTHQPVRALPPVQTVAALRQSVENKFAAGRRLADDDGYRQGECVPWDRLGMA
jgi:hypothetical protein